ncbi:hypothetical protein [Rickettsia endosymbiont of Polydrusus tereticollis]|uniref:hypothetical protein n=1 Tax=Rickettsia endosymbiont of Polydrusus tereticollis TaxID=3066251 RepID=UPI0031330629
MKYKNKRSSYRKKLKKQFQPFIDKNWFKYCYEVDKAYIKYIERIFNSKFLLRFSGFILALYCIEGLLSIKYSFPKFKMFFHLTCLRILLSPFRTTFFNLKLYLKFKNPKNYLKTITFLRDKLNITFLRIIVFYLIIYFVTRILTLAFIKNVGIDSKVFENYELAIFLAFIIVFSLPIICAHISIKNYLQTINIKWIKYKPSIFYISGYIPILFFFLDAFISAFPEINISMQEELKKYTIGCEIKIFIDILYSKLFIKYLFIAYIFHFIGHLVSEYFVDKKYIEEHNILMNKS